MKIKVLFLVSFLLVLATSCKKKKGCTDIRALNYNRDAEVNEGCRYMSDVLAGNWKYTDTGSLLLKDQSGVWHATSYIDSGNTTVTVRSIEQVRLMIDTQQYDLEVTHKDRLSYNATTEYLIDTIYSDNVFCFRYTWHFKQDEKYSGRVILKR